MVSGVGGETGVVLGVLMLGHGPGGVIRGEYGSGEGAPYAKTPLPCMTLAKLSTTPVSRFGFQASSAPVVVLRLLISVSLSFVVKVAQHAMQLSKSSRTGEEWVTPLDGRERVEDRFTLLRVEGEKPVLNDLEAARHVTA